MTYRDIKIMKVIKPDKTEYLASVKLRRLTGPTLENIQAQIDFILDVQS